MAVMMQAFYWDAPIKEQKEGEWWNYIAEKVPELEKAGINALWLPPICKGAEARSPGYDPYDYFDLGDFDQKGAAKTLYGNRGELENLIRKLHEHKIGAYADMVINHNSGADEEEVNPIDGQKRWTKFKPKSGKFPRDWNCFHPSRYERVMIEGENFAGFPHLCHRNPRVYEAMFEYARMVIEELRFVVGEYWSGPEDIEGWLDGVRSVTDNQIAAFDFPLRYKLKDACDTLKYDLRNLTADGSVVAKRPFNAVTFVDNHDMGGNEIVNDKNLAYSFILMNEGYPCIFWYDYFNLGLARAGTPNGIDALIDAHHKYADGEACILHADPDLYILQRSGIEGRPGCVYVLNNLGDKWSGTSVKTKWANQKFKPVAWDGHDTAHPDERTTDADGNAEFPAPPRGYCIYVP